MFLKIHVKFFCSFFFIFCILPGILMQNSIVLAQENIVNILAGVPADFPPQYSIDKNTGRPAGFAIDIMNEIAQRTGLKVQYTIFNTWSDLNYALKEKQIHLIPNCGIISERKSYADFTMPVETFHVSIFIRNSTTDIHGVSDLSGRMVAVVKANKGLFLMKEQENVTLQSHDSLEQALLSLLSGNADAFVYPEPTVKQILRRSGIKDHVKIAGTPLMEIKRGIAVQKDLINLQEKLNNAIRDFIGTPEYKKIYTKWYGKPTPFWNVTKVIIAMGILLALIILCLMIWHYLSIIHLNKNIRALALQLTQMEETEKKKITSELHDRVGQNLTALGINLTIIEKGLSPVSKKIIGDQLSDSMILTDNIFQQIKDVMAEMRPETLDDYGLAAALDLYCEKFKIRYNIKTQIKGCEFSPRLKPEIETTLFRIAQESMTNAAKYAMADMITLTFENHETFNRITIADNGVGFDQEAFNSPGKNNKWGLAIMRERAAAMGVKFGIESKKDMGTKVVMEIKK